MITKDPREHGFIFERTEQGAVTNVPRLVTRHSPTGYEWGYYGSGPADLALNIIEYVLLVEHFIPSLEDGASLEANSIYQEFKERYIARIPREGGSIPFGVVVDYIKEKLSGY